MIPGCTGSWVDIKFIPATPNFKVAIGPAKQHHINGCISFRRLLNTRLKKTTLWGTGYRDVYSVILHGPFTGCLWALGNGLASRNVMEKGIQIDTNGYTWPRGSLFSIHWCITLIDSGCCFHCWFHTPDFTSCTTCVPWTRQTSVSSQHFVYHVPPRVYIGL